MLNFLVLMHVCITNWTVRPKDTQKVLLANTMNTIGN